MPGRGHRVFIEVPSPPRSPRRHYRRHSLSLDERPAYIFQEDLDIMQEREHGLRDVNDSLQRHNQILKGQLQAKEKTIRDQTAWINQLDAENRELRRSVESSSDSENRAKIRDLRKKNTKLETENDTLKLRIRDLLRIAKDATDDRVQQLKEELSTFGKQVVDWRRNYEDLERQHQDLDRRYKRMRQNLDEHLDTIQQLTNENDRLRRNADAEDRSRRRHGH